MIKLIFEVNISKQIKQRKEQARSRERPNISTEAHHMVKRRLEEEDKMMERQKTRLQREKTMIHERLSRLKSGKTLTGEERRKR